MFLKLRPLLYSLVFLGGLELIAFWPERVVWVGLFLLFISLYEGRKIGGRWIFMVLPVFFTLSSVSLLYLITLGYEQQAFIVIAALMYYFSLFSAYRLGKYDGDLTARGMNMAATAATVFFTYAGAYGIYLNFLIPLHYLMLAYLLVTLLVSYQYFFLIRGDQNKKVLVYSFLLALIMAELIWTMNFWPFGYLTTGVVALTLYYILWDLTQSYLLNLLSKKRVVTNLAFFSITIAFVLLSSKWIPVV